MSPTNLPAIVVCAGDAHMRERITGALADQALSVRNHVKQPREVADLDLDPTTIIIVVCDVDRSQDVAALRRLCRKLWGHDHSSVHVLTLTH